MSVPKWAIKRSLILKYCTECTDFVPATVVVGGFFGDEGKGKIISHLASIDSPRIVVRGGAGPNAGHTIKHGGKTFKVRMLPSGFLNESSEIMIGPGVVVDPNVLLGEIAEMQTGGRTYVDANCGIIEESHKVEDGAGRLKEKIGSTGSGTGPANAARAMRTLQMAKECDQIKKYVTDVPARIDESLRKGQNVLVEGTQGTFLSLWHGTYPYVTSKDVTASGICADVGIGPTRVDEVMVVFKSYVTRVGTGPMDGELDAKEIEKRQWGEFGTVTGRARRAAEFNFDLAKRAVMLNGATQIAITKMDVLYPECAHVNNYESMPSNAKKFLENIEEKLGVPVTLVGTGPSSEDIIDRRRISGMSIGVFNSGFSFSRSICTERTLEPLCSCKNDTLGMRSSAHTRRENSSVDSTCMYFGREFDST